MADAHVRLYEACCGLLKNVSAAGSHRPGLQASCRASGRLPRAGGGERTPPWPSAPLRFAERPIRGQPPVSAIIPCFNHGRYLRDCVDSILDQDYPELEVIVIDDASTEDSTLAVLVELESCERVTVLRQPQNSGPSAARNRGIAAASGRYILPVDSDNLLMPGAVASLVAQLQTAGEQVGFIYPNCQYFGTRDDYFQPPSYNLSC